MCHSSKKVYLNYRSEHNYFCMIILKLILLLPLVLSSCCWQMTSYVGSVSHKEIDLQRYALFSFNRTDIPDHILPEEEQRYYCPYILLNERDCDASVVALLNKNTHIIPSGSRRRMKLHENRIDIPQGCSGVLQKRYIFNSRCADALGSVLLKDAYVVKITTPNGISFYAWLPSKYVNE